SFAANPWGLYQVVGNVWQWDDDCYHKNYAGMMGAASAGGSTSWSTACEMSGDGKDTLRVLRGGSWFNLPQVIRSAIRRWDRPGYRGDDLGFRVARGL